MIRIRLAKSITSGDLIDKFGFEKHQTRSDSPIYYRKYIGDYEIQVKLSYPSNVRIQNWDDNRAPWILFKFLLALESGEDVAGKIKVKDGDRYRVLDVEHTLELMTELSYFTDIPKRLSYWYDQYIDGTLKIK